MIPCSASNRIARDERLQAARGWLRQQTGSTGSDWQAVAGDASFRRYFRLKLGKRTRILMDAPPALEDSTAFVDVANRLRRAGLHAPEIVLSDLRAGFLLLEDLGDELFRDLLSPATVDELFAEAFPALAVMANAVDARGLPVYGSELLAGELQWFRDYYLERHRGYALDARGLRLWRELCARLLDNALQQPRVFVHKDIHSCNLLRTRHNSPGIIDFQDAVSGPVTYDFVSLVWDRYINWPRHMIERWMERHRQVVAPGVAPRTWMRWCDLMGVQRNLKIVGRFALLKHEQGKDGYVEMIPRFYGYLADALARYPEFGELTKLLGDPRCAP